MAEAQRRSMTEAHIRGEAQHLVLDGRALHDALQRGEVDAVFKYGAATRDDPGGVAKDIHRISGDFLVSGRPTSSAVITSSVVDRDDDVVYSDGMIVTAGYLKNPVVMPMHLYREIPVGFTEKLAQYQRHVTATWQWLTDIAESDAARYYSLWQNHVLNCTSIGFVPQEWKFREGSDWGLDFTIWELLEHSIVSIPANPDATRTDGVKQYLQLAGEMIFSGPSPLMKSAFERAEHRKVYAPGMKAEKTPDVDVTETAAKSAADADEAIADTPESILGAFEAGVLSKDETTKRLHAWSDKRAAWAERKLAELSVKTIRNQLEV